MRSPAQPPLACPFFSRAVLVPGAARVAAVDRVHDLVPCPFQRCRVVLAEVTFDGGDLPSEAVVGECLGDPAGEVFAGEW